MNIKALIYFTGNVLSEDLNTTKCASSTEQTASRERLIKMKFDNSDIEFSWKDPIKEIKLPNELTEDLAYLTGVHIADGTMNIYRRPRQVYYYYKCCGHQINEKQWYDEILAPFFKKLFNLSVNNRYLSDGTYGFSFSSKAVVTFLSQKMGFPLGKKCVIADFPDIIKKADLKMQLACLRGVFDSDFSLTFKKKHKEFHYYPVIVLGVRSQLLISTVSELLDKIEISYCTYDRSRFDERINKVVEMKAIAISGVKNLEKWFELIGSNNFNNLSKYRIWKKYGFCPIETDVIQRKKILNGKLDPKKLYG